MSPSGIVRAAAMIVHVPLVVGLVAGGCVRAPVRTPEPVDDGLALRDSATIRRKCLAPDSVLAGLRPCELRPPGAAERRY